MDEATIHNSVEVWAFLVSIEEYARKDVGAIWGANQDTKCTSEYLRSELHVPKDHIFELTNTNATRANIISGFQSWLIDNTRITRGDAIYFHFSGHGSRTLAPKGWDVPEEATTDGSSDAPQIEMIIPYDEGMMDASGRPIPGIPDRTLHALLTRVSENFGDNITVVLDCCSSGHGTRALIEEDGAAATCFEEYTPRGIHTSLATPLQEDVDRGILSISPQYRFSDGSPNPQRRHGFHGHSGCGHVLIAACAPHEIALGSKKGGILTRYWLSALRKRYTLPKTYSEVYKDMSSAIGCLRERNAKVKQHPQCEGLGRDRLVFENITLRKDLFLAERSGADCVRVEAGEAQGIELGTLFNLHNLDRRLQCDRVIGTATVVQVFSTYATAMLPGETTLESKCTASVAQESYKLRYTIHNSAPGSIAACGALEYIQDSLKGTPSNIARFLQKLEYGVNVQADITLEIGKDGSVTFLRHDPYLSTLTTVHPRIDPEELKQADFPGIFAGIAHFNRCLALTSKEKPFTDEVSLEFRALDQSQLSSMDILERDVLPLGQEIPFEQTETNTPEVRISESSQDQYVFLLKNRGPTPLFPYLVYFDPATYSIDTWYAPLESEKPTLKAVGESGSPGSVQLGGSSEVYEPFEFAVPPWVSRGIEDELVDTSFIKVWLLTRTAKMDFVNQEGVLGYDMCGASNVPKSVQHRAEMRRAEMRSGWDTITRKITVYRQRVTDIV